MKKLMWILAAAAFVAGCRDDEAKRLGYRGADLEDLDEKMFFSTEDGVTNWVPRRVLVAYEKYDFSADELSLVEAAGTIVPSESFATVPEGYAVKTSEPWFVTWARASRSFGVDGSCGFVAHSNEETRVWETGEAYFSSYHDAKEQALAAQRALAEKVAAYHPGKMHHFPDCWIAEYLRLRVMCLVGRRADGSWTCMLDLVDKCNPGCGVWEPVPAQAERLADARYARAIATWRAEAARKAEYNHQAVERIRAARGIPLFGADAKPMPTGDGHLYYMRNGEFAVSNAVPGKLWKDLREALQTATHVTLPVLPVVASNDCVVFWSVFQTNDLYSVRLDMAVPREGEGCPEEGAWRELCIEKILPGFEPPPPPVRR